MAVGANDAAVFMRTSDFGVRVVWDKYETTGVLNQPDQSLEVGDRTAKDLLFKSKAHTLTYPTADLPGLTPGQTVKVDDVNYRVRNVEVQGDGLFTLATLGKV